MDFLGFLGISDGFWWDFWDLFGNFNGLFGIFRNFLGFQMDFDGIIRNFQWIFRDFYGIFGICLIYPIYLIGLNIQL